jgi:hypothetical protein
MSVELRFRVPERYMPLAIEAVLEMPGTEQIDAEDSSEGCSCPSLHLPIAGCRRHGGAAFLSGLTAEQVHGSH